ncbi:hypothetical protein CQ14_33580 [Bradyrhizobium lablabi]|uniref:Uncharacterized protein n=1 Tax=Bradyrhizobium lablabi TaxID=722472 RepID=A0A0R3MSQ2_9BRAD|nr:hypothetical protein CQ14_33580 [Bradyrhizobium lablabi]
MREMMDSGAALTLVNEKFGLVVPVDDICIWRQPQLSLLPSVMGGGYSTAVMMASGGATVSSTTLPSLMTR